MIFVCDVFSFDDKIVTRISSDEWSDRSDLFTSNNINLLPTKGHLHRIWRSLLAVSRGYRPLFWLAIDDGAEPSSKTEKTYVTNCSRTSRC